MSVRIMSRVWDNAAALEGTQLLMLLALADHANDEGVCWPKMDRLAQKVRVGVRQAQRLVRELEHGGYISVAQGVGRGNPSLVTILNKCEASAEKVTSGARKGDMHDTISPIKGDTHDTFSPIKGDAGDTFSEREKVTSGAQKVTSGARKGDMAPHTRKKQPSLEPSLKATISKDLLLETPQPTQSPPDNSKGQPRTPQQLFFDRVCWVVGWDHRTLSKEQRGQVAQVVGVLQGAKYTADDIARFWQEVWQKDFRYRKEKARPNLGQLRAEIGKLRVGERDLEAQSDGTNTELPEEEFRRQYHAAQPRGKRPLAGLDPQREAAAGGGGVQLPTVPGQEVRAGGRAGDAPALREGAALPVPGVGGSLTPGGVLA